jgi:hypothetical protein
VYYVQVASDSTGALLAAAKDSLNALPQVGIALYELFLENVADYRKLNDGGIYQPASWDATGSSTRALTTRWGLEEAALPLAWGCDTGSVNVRVAVVDIAFHSTIPDLQSAQVHSPVVSPAGSNPHGDGVASIAGARGNNGTGLTGVMWASSLHLFEIGDGTGKTPYMLKRIMEAGELGIPIINLSLGIGWDSAALMRIEKNIPTPPNSKDSARLDQFENQLVYIVNTLKTMGKVPLIVTSAGNDNFDAEWSGKQKLAIGFPDQILVVASAAKDSAGGITRAPSVWGAVVQIGAPGEHVGILTHVSPNVPTVENGTSLSAPMVSGVAGLLLSFEPSLNAAQLKQAILEGARRGGKTINAGAAKAPIPVLNAYESLKYVAETPGRRLCGNEVWAANSRMFARHGSASTQLFTIGTTTEAVTDLSVAHGGSQIQFNIITAASEAQAKARKIVNGAWRLDTKYDISNPPTGYHPGGTGLSALFISHDRTVIGQVQNSLTAVAGQEHVFVTLNGATVQNIAVKDYPIGPPGRQGGCASYKEGVGCDRGYDHPPIEGVWTTVGAISPQQRFVLVAVNRRIAQTHNLTGTWITSTDPDGGIRYTYPEVYEWVSDKSYVYRIDLATNIVTHLGTLADATIYWLAISEDDKKVMFGIGDEYRTEMYAGTREPVEWADSERVVTGCVIQFRTVDLSAHTFTNKATDYACPEPSAQQQGGNATVAPRPRIQLNR